MTDIFKEWKNRKFVSTVNESTSEYKHLIILTDFSYWAASIDELEDWCDHYGCKREGMTVDIPNEKTLTLFCLRWS